MLRLIRLFPAQDVYAVQGAPGEELPVGTLADANSYLMQMGVPACELAVAQEWLRQRPENNAVDFGVMWAACTTTLNVDVMPIRQLMGLV